METKVPFDEYHLRIYRARQQLSVQTLDLTHGSSKSPLQKISELTLSDAQRKFFCTLLELPGVLHYIVVMDMITIYKWPGFEWDDIESVIIDHIEACPVTDSDLKTQIGKIVSMAKN
ncbi:MAG: hypothetical protein JWM92_349 [Candidatus Nomurabacteria bacterium]|nr:hypothetical protein [Candidatus Nomurabacteria bacterium]